VSLLQLSVKNVRNLQECCVNFDSRFNLVEGANASGKTSLLEAIHLISQVKSFRTHRINQLIQQQADEMQVVAQYQDHTKFTHTIGLARNRSTTQIHLNKQTINLSSKLAALVPVQIITPESHRLLEDGPKLRRQFIDWGVFHVKHSFLQIWKDYHRILRQRNACLRHRPSQQQINSWNLPLIVITEKFHLSRLEYVQALTPIVIDFCQQLIGEQVEIDYQPGWSNQESFEHALRQSFEQDCQFKHTRVGPHRADLVIKSNGVPAQVGFSRGQQKLLVCALRLAQIMYLQSYSKQSCIILVDDLPAELDKSRRQKLLKLLDSTGAQIFITTTDAELLQNNLESSQKLFHVKHGEIKEVVY